VFFQYGGEGGIRTLDTISCIHTFQACSLSLSDTSPYLVKPFGLSRRANVVETFDEGKSFFQNFHVLKQITLSSVWGWGQIRLGPGFCLKSGTVFQQESGAEAAVDGQACASDVTGFRACQVGDEAGDFFSFAVAPDCDQRDQGVYKFSFGRIHVGVDRADPRQGFEVLVPHDACFTVDQTDFFGTSHAAQEVHAVSLGNLHGEYATVLSTAEILAGMSQA
jgi:hypothetical protein